MYTQVPCDYCHRAKALLKGYGVTPLEYRVDMDSRRLEEMKRRVPQSSRTVPQIFIGGHRVGGFTELYKLHQEGKLRELLTSP
jgi:glutaredoxin 3